MYELNREWTMGHEPEWGNLARMNFDLKKLLWLSNWFVGNKPLEITVREQLDNLIFNCGIAEATIMIPGT